MLSDMLTDEERSRLVRSCFNHEVAHCDTCRAAYHFRQLMHDSRGPRRLLCPRCRTDVTEMLKWHLRTCAVVAGRRCIVCGREIAFGDLFAIAAGGREHLACHFGRPAVVKQAS